jgi:ribosomal protein S27E
MDQKEVESRIQGLKPEQAKAVVCALVGHSRIVDTCMGYIHCARCGEQVGDSLGGSGSTKENVIVGHACPTCRENFSKCDWRDTFMTPDPFDAEKVKEQEDARAERRKSSALD